MSHWKMLTLTLAMMVAFSLADEIQLQQRPARPSYFSNSQQVKDYLEKVKAYYASAGTRYGKRASNIAYKKLGPTRYGKSSLQSSYEDTINLNKEDYLSLYNILAYYNAM